jgi:DNA modification methylase
MKNSNISLNLFQEIDFQFLLEDKEFKEDSVREVIILPLLKAMGYEEKNIIRSKTLQHPYLTIGSKRKPVTLIPDYALKIDKSYVWILDAKSPGEPIKTGKHVEQAFSYACHPEIRSNFFALCNGHEFSLFKTFEDSSPILYFEISKVNEVWEDLLSLLSPNSFKAGKSYQYEFTKTEKQPHSEFDYSNRPLLSPIKPDRQNAPRHYGVHGYFTRQPWNIVAQYINNYTQPGDTVLDPFSGSGVTAIEALVNNRKAIAIDINPLAIFIVNSLIIPVADDEFFEAFDRVCNEYISKEPKTKKDINKILKDLPYPKNVLMPEGSDSEKLEDFFSKTQLAKLALLKSLIEKEYNPQIRDSLMLMFSGLLNRINLTFHASGTRSAGRGDSSIFRMYRYRLAPNHEDIDILHYFTLRFKKVLKAKKDIEYHINQKTIANALIQKGSATNLSFIQDESVDYIYTDPPYGKKIQYIDLSVMWNAWLDLPVTPEDREQEAVEGGMQKKSKQEYSSLIASSIREMYRVLKFDRWLSFVFAHQDPEFWHLILDTAESCGFEYMGAVQQSSGKKSFKKRQHPFTVLSGQLIINFKKTRTPRAIMRANLGMNMADIIIQTIEGVIAKHDGATIEQINDELIIKGLELGFLDLLKKEYSDLSPILMDNFDYDENEEIFKIQEKSKFKSNVDVKLRIKYFTISYMRRIERECKTATFDEITLHILPLLKNGITPENQTILSVLEDIAYKVGNGWKLKQDGQLSLGI